MKKLASGFILCLMLAGSGLVAHANPADVNLKDNEPVKIEGELELDEEQASIELIKPQPDYMVTTNSTVVISGKGIEGTSVVLEVYGEEKVIIEIKDEDEDEDKDLDLESDEDDGSQGAEDKKSGEDEEKKLDEKIKESGKEDEDGIEKPDEQAEGFDEDRPEKQDEQVKESDNDEDEKVDEKVKESDREDKAKKSDKKKKKKSKSKKFTKRLKRENFEIGSMGLFAKEVKLNVGENKIILRSKADGTKIERIVKYKKIEEEDVKKSMDEIQEKGMTELINDICSQN